MSTLPESELKALRERYEAYIERWKADGNPVVEFACPHCQHQTERTRPSKRGETWDSMETCVYCGGYYFFAVKSTGPIDVRAVTF